MYTQYSLCTVHVYTMFTTYMYKQCSLCTYVQKMYTQCSLRMYICTVYAHNVHYIHVHTIFTMYSKYTHNVHYVQYMYTHCSLCTVRVHTIRTHRDFGGLLLLQEQNMIAIAKNTIAITTTRAMITAIIN